MRTLLAALLLTGAQTQAPLSVAVERLDGRDWWSLEAKDVPVEKLLRSIAREGGLELEGLGRIQGNTLVHASLTRRPLDQVLQYVLGSAGARAELRRGVISLYPDGLGDVARDELLLSAAAEWVSVTSRYPAHVEAPDAFLAQGEIAELRGLEGAARGHYQAVIEAFPDSDAVNDALMRSGRILKRQSNWVEAALHFRDLANRAEGVEYHATARLELARCSVELGNPENAQYILNSLETNYPVHSSIERSERQFVRAEALNALEQHMDALRVLDELKDENDPLIRRSMLNIQAVSLEGVGLFAEAGRAWLLYAQKGSDDERRKGYTNAARLGLVAKDEVGVLFICREAQAAGLDQGLGEYWKTARTRLGLDEGEEKPDLRTEERLQHAEAQLDAGRAEQAAEILEGLYLGRGALEEDLSARVVVAWGRCIEARDGLSAALNLFIELRPSFSSLEARSRLDVGAAKLLEERGRFDLAIDAYEGRYTLPEDLTGGQKP